jgi:hypothetical protein
MLCIRVLGSADVAFLKGVDSAPFSLNVEFTAQKARKDLESWV